MHNFYRRIWLRVSRAPEAAETLWPRRGGGVMAEGVRDTEDLVSRNFSEYTKGIHSKALEQGSPTRATLTLADFNSQN